MKTFVAFITLFLALASATIDIHVVCKESEDGFVVFVPHPYECQKYFMCMGTVGIAMECPANLQFDPVLNVCNYPGVVGCVNTPYPTTSTEAVSTTTEAETTTSETGEETTFFNEEYVDYAL